jgi:Na+/H+ antiporter NhaD/arsenite permease-like protein
MQSLGLYIFLVTYVLISARRLSWLELDRPAGALFGAVTCVALGVLTPDEARGAVDGETILLLFGVMGMGAFLAISGFFFRVEEQAARVAKTQRRLLGQLIWVSGALSMLITNDAVCILGAPMVVRLIKRFQLPPLPFLLALATSANTGSVATLVGNPQNMLCGNLGGLLYRDHLMLMLPVAIMGLALNHLLLVWMFRKELADKPIEATPQEVPNEKGSRRTLTVIAGTALVYTFGADLAWTAAAGFVLLMFLHRRDTRQLWELIDWSVLLFFAALFVVVEGFIKSGAPAWLFAHFPLAGDDSLLGWMRLSGIFLVGSNIVSNVPFIMVVKDQMSAMSDPQMAWEMLAMASTFAGNLTILGSVANVIVAENARDVGGIGFWQYLRVGAPLAILTTLIGTIWLVALG